MRSSNWVSLCGLLAAVCCVQATHAVYSTFRCNCNGRSPYCLRDAWGLHCVDCQGNTEGRHCERCKDGFYLERAGLSCTPCRCNSTGSVGTTCDRRGRCSCKNGVRGEKCDSCPGGPIGPNGCSQRRQLRQDSGSFPCFCYGHSSLCSPASGYSVRTIISNFTDGPEGWTTATSQGLNPDGVQFRWSPKYQDLEVISEISHPVYLYAPAPFLGNRLLSYGQNLSFSLRLDRGVQHPSTNDVILEGSGLRVSASLGDLLSIVTCGQKFNYGFRLDELPGSRWRPQLSSFQFQNLLQNLTAIKIRTTVGENGRGYLDNVKLMLAERGAGVPARWVQNCRCPPGYEGDFCEQCSAGFRRSVPSDGAFSTCQPCSCRGGSCDPLTGDCYSADETTADTTCSRGFYREPWQPQDCVKCPCADGGSCSVAAGSLEPRCDSCPLRTTGPRCDVCQEGFYGDPAGGAGCRPCRCNGHIDVSVAGSCDRRSGECLKCLNNTRGRSCEECARGFYHSRAADACKPCDCDLLGSESTQCDDSGRCRCRLGFEGMRCQRSDCPSCFSPIKLKMEAFTVKLKELDMLVKNGGLKPGKDADLEATLRAMEDQVDDLKDDTEFFAEQEKILQRRLATISKNQLTEGQDIQNIEDAVDDIRRRQQTYRMKVGEVQTLIEDMKRQLDRTRTGLQSVDIPLSDAIPGPDLLSSLVETATSLADKHKMKAGAVEKSAGDALSDSGRSLALVRTLMNKENKVKELIGDLKTTYDQMSAQANTLENQATRLSSDAGDESKMADGMLKDIVNLEQGIPLSLKEGADAMVSTLDGLKKVMDRDIPGFQALKNGVQQDTITCKDLLARGNVSQKKFDGLVDRIDIAKDDTDAALRGILRNTAELDDSLMTLRGFDQQIDGGKTLADNAIKRLPGIKTTIQQAVRDNTGTLSMLGDVSRIDNHTLGTISALEKLVTSLEGGVRSLPTHTGLLNEATKLNRDTKELKTKAAAAALDLSSELDAARRLEADAEQAADGALAAFTNARQTRAAVGKTLGDVNKLLANINQGGQIDDNRLKELEDSLAGAQRDVDQNLRPRLRVAGEKEAAQRRHLNSINQDIVSILMDITNLEEILMAIPSDCFNNQQIEWS